MKILNGFKTIFTYIFVLIFIALINSVYGVNNQVVLLFENILILLFLGHKYLDDLVNDFKKIKKPKEMVIRNFKYYIVFFVLMLIVNFIITRILGDIASNEKLNRALISEKPFYALISLIFITPICEEIVFRLSFKDFNKSEKVKILVTSLLFSLTHVLLSFKNAYSLVYMLPYFFLGLAFGTIYFKEKNIFVSTFYHSMHNLLSIAVIILSSGKL